LEEALVLGVNYMLMGLNFNPTNPTQLDKNWHASLTPPWNAQVEMFKCLVNSIVYGGMVTQVQLRLSQKTLEEIDRWVAEGRFKNRSDAIRTIVNFYEEREKTREFYKMLTTRSEEAKKHPEALIPLEDLQ